MRDALCLAVLELYNEMGCLLREAQAHLPPEAFHRMIAVNGIPARVAKKSMRLASEFDGMICH